MSCPSNASLALVNIGGGEIIVILVLLFIIAAVAAGFQPALLAHYRRSELSIRHRRVV